MTDYSEVEWDMSVPEAPKHIDAEAQVAEAIAKEAGNNAQLPVTSPAGVEAMRKSYLRQQLEGTVADESVPLEMKAQAVDIIRQRYDKARAEDNKRGLQNSLRGQDGLPLLSDGVYEQERLTTLKNLHEEVGAYQEESATLSVLTMGAPAALMGEELRTKLGIKPVSAQDVGKTAEVALTPGQNFRYAGMLSQVFPEINFGAWDRVSSFEASRKVRDRLLQLPAEERHKRIEALADELKKNAGLLGENQQLYVGFMQTLLSAMDGENHPILETVDTVAGVLDLVALGGIVRSGVKGIAGLGKAAQKLIPGSVAAGAARTKSGGAVLQRAAERGDAERLGTSAAAIIEEQAVMARRGTPPSDYLPNEYLRAEEKSAILATEEMKSLVPGKRFKDSRAVEREDGTGFGIAQTFGKANGAAYASEAAAKAAAATFGMPAKAIPGQGGWFLEVAGGRNWKIDDAGEFVSDAVTHSQKGAGAWRPLQMAFDAQTVRLTTKGVGKSDAAINNLRKVGESYFRTAGADRQIVDDALHASDGVGHMSVGELTTRGLNAGQQAAYYSARRIADFAYHVNEARARQWADLKGFTKGFVKGSDTHVARALHASEAVPPRVYDIDAGAVVAYKTADRPFVYRLAEPVKIGNAEYNFAKVVRTQDSGMPATLLPRRPGHLDRTHTHTHYVWSNVKKVVDGDDITVPVIHGGARSMMRAEAIAKDLNAQAGYEKYLARPSHEMEHDVLGQLGGNAPINPFTAHRIAGTIVDLDSQAERLLSVSATVDRMMHSAATQRGIGIWADVGIKRLQNSFPEAKIELTGVPAWGNIKNVEQRLKAEQEFTHIRRQLGISSEQAAGWWQGMRNDIADYVLDWGFERTGRFIAGVDGTAMRAAKNATAVQMLITNVARQWLMNVQMIPQYFGIEGAMRYAVNGGFLADASILAAARIGTKEAHMAGKAAGRSVADVDLLLHHWDTSNLSSLVDSHILLMGTMAGGSRTAAVSKTMASVQKGVNTLAEIGIKSSARFDKSVAFLLARNRWRVNNGRLPHTADEISEVASFTEHELTLAQSRADSPVLQEGILGLVLQFQSFTIKYTARMAAQAAAMVNIALPKSMKITRFEAGQLTQKELRRQFGISLLMGGGTAYSAMKVGDYFERETGIKVPQGAKDLVDKGIEGYLVDQTFQMFDDPEGKQTRLNFSAEFSPSGSTVNTVKGVYHALKIFAETGGAGDMDIPSLSIPALGMAAGYGEVIKLGVTLGLHPGITSGETFEAVRDETMRNFPVVNNFMKGAIAYNSGYLVDGEGERVVKIGKGAAAAKAMFGINSEDAVGYRQLIEARYGAYENRTEDDGAKATRDQAESDWDKIERVVLQNNTDAHLRYDDADKKIGALIQVRKELLGPEFLPWLGMLQRKREEFFDDRTKGEKLATRMRDEIERRKVAPETNYIREIEQAYDFDGKEQLVDYVTRLKNNKMLVDFQ